MWSKTSQNFYKPLRLHYFCSNKTCKIDQIDVKLRGLHRYPTLTIYNAATFLFQTILDKNTKEWNQAKLKAAKMLRNIFQEIADAVFGPIKEIHPLEIPTTVAAMIGMRQMETKLTILLGSSLAPMGKGIKGREGNKKREDMAKKRMRYLQRRSITAKKEDYPSGNCAEPIPFIAIQNQKASLHVATYNFFTDEKNDRSDSEVSAILPLLYDDSGVSDVESDIYESEPFINCRCASRTTALQSESLSELFERIKAFLNEIESPPTNLLADNDKFQHSLEYEAMTTSCVCILEENSYHILVSLSFG